MVFEFSFKEIEDRFRDKISDASGRSVKMIFEIEGRARESVRPTIPQPAPSSRTFRPCF